MGRGVNLKKDPKFGADVFGECRVVRKAGPLIFFGLAFWILALIRCLALAVASFFLRHVFILCLVLPWFLF